MNAKEAAAVLAKAIGNEDVSEWEVQQFGERLAREAKYCRQRAEVIVDYDTIVTFAGPCKWGHVPGKKVHLIREDEQTALCNVKGCTWQRPRSHVQEWEYCKYCVSIAIESLPLQVDSQPWDLDQWLPLNKALLGIGVKGDALIVVFPGKKGGQIAYRYPKRAQAFDELADTRGRVFFTKYRKRWLYYERWDGKEWVHKPKRRVDTKRQGRIK